jgi:hypothetical protein
MDIVIPKTRPKEDTAFWQCLEKSIRLGLNKEKVLAEQRQRETARLEAMIPRQTVEGLGQLTAIIDTETYLRWHHFDPGCWSDKKFGREFIRDNPTVRANRPDKKFY